MARSYDMRRRGRAAAETRRRIIDAAHALLDRPEGGSLALHEVAEMAGVTRATIHNRVGSRRDLLEAVFRDQGVRIGFDRVLEALEMEDPTQAILQTVRESCRAWSVSPLAIRRTLSLAALDPEVGPIVEAFELKRRERLGALIDRLAEAGGLPPDLGRAEALTVFALVTAFPAYDALTLDGAHERAERLLVRQITVALGLPPGTRSP